MIMYVSVTLDFVVNGHKAMGFCHPEGPDTIWLPHSEIRNLTAVLDDSPYDHHAEVEVEIPQWLAEKKALDPYCEELEDEVH